MGDVPAGHISKGVVHVKVDKLVNHRDANGNFDKRAAFLAALRLATTPDGYVQILKDQAGVTDGEAEYLNEYFYKPGERWWEDLQPIFPILHQGLIKALEEAGNNLLLDSYWLPAGASTVDVIVCKTSVQVTRIFLTPPPPPPPPDEPSKMRKKPTSVWLLTARGTSTPKVDDRTSDAVVEKVDGDVVTWRIQEFADSTATAT